MNQSPGSIVILISYVTELIFDIEQMLKVGQTLHGRFSTGHGGKGLNMAVGVRRLGPTPTMIGRVGRDGHTEAALAFLAAEGLDTSTLVRDDAGGAAGVIVRMPDGANAIVIDAGANLRLSTADIDRHHSSLRGAAVALAQLELPQATAAHAFAIARAGGAITVLNPAPAPTGPLDKSLLDVCDIVTPNQTEAMLMTGIQDDSDESLLQAARQLGAGVRDVIITVGERGALVCQRSGKVDWVRPPSVRVVDTSGAGDAFNGGLVTALAEGRSLVDAARFAVRVASLKCTRAGTSVAMPWRNEVDA
jgi:ribokinase